jgi:hypothetical protein
MSANIFYSRDYFRTIIKSYYVHYVFPKSHKRLYRGAVIYFIVVIIFVQLLNFIMFIKFFQKATKDLTEER